MTDDATPTVDAGAIAADPADAAVAGVVLAAGTSSRFGDRNKLLAPVDGDPLVRRATRTLVASVVDPVVVVLGHDAERVRRALDGLPVETRVNPDFAAGRASTLETGVRAVDAAERDVDAAVVGLGDMPWVSPNTVDALVAAHAAGVGAALAAARDGARGNPVLFHRRFFDALAGVSGDVGGRRVLLDADASALVDVDDPGVRRDVDRPRDV